MSLRRDLSLVEGEAVVAGATAEEAGGEEEDCGLSPPLLPGRSVGLSAVEFGVEEDAAELLSSTPVALSLAGSEVAGGLEAEVAGGDSDWGEAAAAGVLSEVESDLGRTFGAAAGELSGGAEAATGFVLGGAAAAAAAALVAAGVLSVVAAADGCGLPASLRDDLSLLAGAAAADPLALEAVVATGVDCCLRLGALGLRTVVCCRLCCRGAAPVVAVLAAATAFAPGLVGTCPKRPTEDFLGCSGEEEAAILGRARRRIMGSTDSPMRADVASDGLTA